MKKNILTNQAGQADSKQITIIAIITIVAALMIVAIFVLLSNRQAPAANTDDFLKNIEAQRQKQNKPGAVGNTGNTQETLSLAGVLTEIKTDSLVIIEKDTQNKITISLSDNTSINYSGQKFDRSRFYIGDQLQITAINAGDKLVADEITVLVSASPATAAPVPPAANVRPDGTIKPL